ncbi:MAG: ABC transporter ATP-binding protein [Candidatus Bathyarchaeota archaeon]|nr:MAG: ABC transporter ATP-binding protein [Candidatus Bathyarchaeota archaeon]
MGLLDVENLTTYFDILRGEVKAVENISFTVEKGDAFGLAGESGCGKTTTALSILRLLPQNGKVISGEIHFEGKNLLEMNPEKYRKDIRWKKISVIFQGAMNSLNPVMTVGQQISEAILTHENLSKEEALDRAGKLLDLVGIGSERVERYAHELSGGMRQRAIIAMALSSNPSFIIADEPTTALDVIIEAQVLKVIKDLQKKLNIAMAVISHDLSMIAETCDRIGIMYAGKIVERGDIARIYKEPFHPYTKLLLGAFPSILGPIAKLSRISGFPPDLLSPPPGCRFHPRCPYAMDKCGKEDPQSIHIKGEDHFVACHLVE